MPQISISTLQYAISAIAGDIKELQQAIDDNETVPEDYQRMEDLERAASELEAQYDEAAKTVLNLTPYNELVGE
jgi:cell shape-determining protein MreC